VFGCPAPWRRFQLRCEGGDPGAPPSPPDSSPLPTEAERLAQSPDCGASGDIKSVSNTTLCFHNS